MSQSKELSWPARHILYFWTGINNSIDDVLLKNWENIQNPDDNILNLLYNLGDFSICVNQDIDGASVLNIIEQTLNKIGFCDEVEARELFKKALWMLKYIGYSDDDLINMSQEQTSTDKSVYAYTGRSEKSVVITLRLRLFPERICLWQLIEKNRLMEFQNLLEKELSISWMSKYSISNIETNFDWEIAESIAWKLIKKCRSYKYNSTIKMNDIVSEVLSVFSALEKELPHVLEALESRTVCIWKRLCNVTFLFCLGNAVNSYIPQSVWKEAFILIGTNRDKADEIIHTYAKENSISKQLIDNAKDGYFSTISLEDVDRATVIIDTISKQKTE
jgi:hypothetical protein